jgi:hypothetical protein
VATALASFPSKKQRNACRKPCSRLTLEKPTRSRSGLSLSGLVPCGFSSPSACDPLTRLRSAHPLQFRCSYEVRAVLGARSLRKLPKIKKTARHGGSIILAKDTAYSVHDPRLLWPCVRRRQAGKGLHGSRAGKGQINEYEGDSSPAGTGGKTGYIAAP